MATVDSFRGFKVPYMLFAEVVCTAHLYCEALKVLHNVEGVRSILL